MQKEDPDDRPRSRRNSTRRNSLKKENSLEEKKRESPHSTPKRVVKSGSSVVDFMVTGKQIAKRSDRANSLPGSSRREVRHMPMPKRLPTPVHTAHSTQSAQSAQQDSIDDDVSLDLSQVSDFEDTNSKYGVRKMAPLATSTPKPRVGPKPRSASQSQLSHITHKLPRSQKSFDAKCRDTSQNSLQNKRDSVFSCSRDSLYRTSSSASPYRYGTEDYSSVSPEYSGQSSTELSPRAPTDTALSPRSQQLSSCCVSSWEECSATMGGTTGAPGGTRGAPGGEWDHFWNNYNYSLTKVPMKNYYDQCPTPYRTEDIDLNDFDISIDDSRKRSPSNIDNINNIIRNEGLQLTPRETQNIIKCAHILGNVLSKAIERRSREYTVIEDIKDMDNKRRNLKLDLKDTAIPLPAVEKKSETVTTQTDISLPNTKSAPRIFENILRQLSKSSIDETDVQDTSKKIPEENEE